MQTDSLERLAWYREVAERRGEQLRQADIQIAHLRAALEDISLGGNGAVLKLIADTVLHEEWGCL
jgi:c-di-GMP-binding flagellar brake protein YcgR